MKILITYFSASGRTKNAALLIKEATDGVVEEIIPKEKYTKEDLNWNNKTSRSSIAMQDITNRPEIENSIDISNYDVIFLGYPIWWYTAPRIINTFLEKYDFKDKIIIPFCTSGGSEINGSINDLKNTYKDYNFKRGIRITEYDDVNKIKDIIKEVIK